MSHTMYISTDWQNIAIFCLAGNIEELRTINLFQTEEILVVGVWDLVKLVFAFPFSLTKNGVR